MSSVSWDYVTGSRSVDPDRDRDRGRGIEELRGAESDRQRSGD